jgi:CRP-like cAMP-binding protein
MISPELLRRYPFFGGLEYEHISRLSKTANELTAEADHIFFHEADRLTQIYLILEGAVAITIEVPERGIEHKLADQFSREIRSRDIVVSSLGPGEVFGWSGLVSPFKASANAKALTRARVIAFDAEKILQLFEEDTTFGYRMIQKIVQVVRDRLHSMRIESLALVAAPAS